MALTDRTQVGTLWADPVATRFEFLLPLLLAGYMFFDRSFAYFHIPGTPVFVGEIVLVFGLAGAFRILTWPPLWRVSDVPVTAVLYVAWGLILLVPGFFDDPLIALRDAVIWGYLIVAFAVISVLAHRPFALSRWLGWYRAVIPALVAWLPLTVVIEPLDLGRVPDSDVTLTSFGGGRAAVQLLMAVAFLWLVSTPKSVKDARWRIVMTGVALAGVLVLATGNRGGFLAAVIGSILFLVLYPARSRLIVTAVGALVVVATLTVVLDPRISIGERELSANQFTANVVSIVTREGEGGLAGNISWRLRHWGDIWDGVNRDHPFTGHGFGPNIAEIYLVPQTDIGLRNAHNSHLTVLARSGWIGLGLWMVLWALWYREVNASRRRLRAGGLESLAGVQAWAMVGVTAIHVEAFFNPSIEGPQTAFWLWTLFGLALFLAMISHRGTEAPGPRNRGRDLQTTYDLPGLEKLLTDL